VAAAQYFVEWSPISLLVILIWILLLFHGLVCTCEFGVCLVSPETPPTPEFFGFRVVHSGDGASYFPNFSSIPGDGFSLATTFNFIWLATKGKRGAS